METWTEGLKVYRVIQEVRNNYFLDVEYHILRCNRIPEMLSVQIRDQDGERRLLYEITGLKSMKALGDVHVLTLQEYQTFLEDCESLIESLDKYMLDINQVSFEPEDIFQEQSGHVRWVYTPKPQDDISGKITRLFEWLLSMIDYGNMKTVQFAYHAYWCIRKHTLSKQVIRECLNYAGEEIAQYTAESYDEFFRSELSSDYNTGAVDADRKVSAFSRLETRDERGKEIYLDADNENIDMHEEKGHIFLALEILCITVAVILIAALIVFLVIGILQNILKEMKYIYFSLVIVLLILCDCILQLHKNRKILSEKEKYNVMFHKEIPAPSYNYSWEQEGGTEVLGIRKDMLQPALKDEDNGKVCVIKEFPFYIGSHPEINHLVISDATVSRHHAVIVRGRQTGYYDLQDLRSTNGTWVNQTALVYEKPVKLNPGDMIRFAAKRFEFIMLDCPMGECFEPQEKH